ncbi:MAG: GDSL family lipase, partial [Planctomycetota bacterium]
MKRMAISSLICFFASIVLVTCLTATAGAQEAKPHSAITPVPRGGGWMNRHKNYNARVAKGSADLLFIGDSITQAWESVGRRVWMKHYGKRNAVNLVVSGDRTEHVLWRLDNGNIKGISPKAAV